MNKIYIDINYEKGTLIPNGINLITGDFASTEINFTFDREDGTKVFEMKSPSGEVVMAEEIVDNKILLRALDENENNVSLFKESGMYIFEVSLYSEGSKLTSVFGELPVQKEQVIIDGEIVEPYLPIFDELMQEIDSKIDELDAAVQGVENLDIDAEKVEHTTTITITDKEGNTKEVQVLDGEKGEKGEKGDAGAIKMIIVAELPETGADDTIYLVPLETPDVQGNNYAEYVYINGAWELLGKIGVQVDLTDYVKNTDYASGSKAGVFKTGSTIGVNTNGVIYGITRTYAQYQNDSDGNIINRGTLENVITGKGLVSNTDYASSNTAGVIKTKQVYGVVTNQAGELAGNPVTYENYPNYSTYGLICKGTLENVISGKGLVSNTNYASNSTGGVIKIHSDYASSIYNGFIYPLELTYSEYNQKTNFAFISKGTLENVLNARIGDIDSVLDAINGEVI